MLIKLKYRGTQPRLIRFSLLAVIFVLSIATYHRRDGINRRLEDWRLEHESRDNCTAYPDRGNIAVIVKTGATEAERVLPLLLRTSLRCVEDPIIVSDLEQEVAGHTIHNVLADFNSQAIDDNSDWDIYRLQQRYKSDGREKEIPKLAEIPIPNGDWRTEGKSAAWGLDKYKNIRMVDLAWRMQPDREWYIFIDADTYLVWSNLGQWLSTMNPAARLYAGKPVRMYEHRPHLDFAYGGAGILLSGAAVRAYAEANFVERWDRRIQGWWFGDFMLGDALFEELNLTITDGTPMLGADNIVDTAYGPSNWCRPVVTMHHLARQDTMALYKVERTARSSTVLAKDVHDGVDRKDRSRVLGDWDNRSEDEGCLILLKGSIAVIAHQSVTACGSACQEQDECFQWSFAQQTETSSDGVTKTDSQCFLSNVFRDGRRRDPEEWTNRSGSFRKTWTSGWNSVRIHTWTRSQADCSGDEDLWRLKVSE